MPASNTVESILAAAVLPFAFLYHSVKMLAHNRASKKAGRQLSAEYSKFIKQRSLAQRAAAYDSYWFDADGHSRFCNHESPDQP